MQVLPSIYTIIILKLILQRWIRAIAEEGIIFNKMWVSYLEEKNDFLENLIAILVMCRLNYQHEKIKNFNFHWFWASKPKRNTVKKKRSLQ